jgi:hypothetical protein
MKAIDRPFTKIINGTTQFVIPIFQRDCGWTEGIGIQPFARRAILGGSPTDVLDVVPQYAISTNWARPR